MGTKEKEWLINSEAEGKLTAVLGTNGRLKISDALFKKLPEHIRFRFDCDSRILYIKATNSVIEESYTTRKSMTVHRLSFDIIKEKLSIPIRFDLRYNYVDKQWVGKVDLLSRKRKNYKTQMMILYKPMLNYFIYYKAKSIPLVDRKQLTYEALFEVARIYNRSYGDFDEFACFFIKMRLKEENRKYVQFAQELSMDAPRTNKDGDYWCLYDKVGSETDVSAQAVENIINKDLKANFKEKSELLMKMTLQGYTLSQIAEKLCISEEDVFTLADMIGQKRNNIDHDKVI